MRLDFKPDYTCWCGHSRAFHPRGRTGPRSCTAVSQHDWDMGIEDWDLATNPCMCERYDPELPQEVLPGTSKKLIVLMA